MNILTNTGRELPKNKCISIQNNWYEVVPRNVKAKFPNDSCIVVEELSKDGKNAHRRLAPVGQYFWSEQDKLYIQYNSDTYVKTQDGLEVVLLKTAILAATSFDYHNNKDVSTLFAFKSEEEAIKAGYRISPYNGIFYPFNNSSMSLFSKIYDIENNGNLKSDYVGRFGKWNYNTFDLGQYGQDGNIMFDVLQNYFDNVASKNLKSTNISKYNKFLNHTFGLEFEAWHGHLPEFLCFKNGLLPVKDGSLEGAGTEYITTIIKPNNALERIEKMCDDMSTVLTANKSCSLHIHVGNVPTDKKYIVALYMLLYQLRSEFFQVIPPYKHELGYLLTKRPHPKDHCKDNNLK